MKTALWQNISLAVLPLLLVANLAWTTQVRSRIETLLHTITTQLGVLQTTTSVLESRLLSVEERKIPPAVVELRLHQLEKTVTELEARVQELVLIMRPPWE